MIKRKQSWVSSLSQVWLRFKTQSGRCPILHPAWVGSGLVRDTRVSVWPGNIKRWKYHCTIGLLFDGFGVTTDNFCSYLQNRLIQISQTGGQRYCDTSWLSKVKYRYTFSSSLLFPNFPLLNSHQWHIELPVDLETKIGQITKVVVRLCNKFWRWVCCMAVQSLSLERRVWYRCWQV